MYIKYLQSNKLIDHMTLLSLAIILLGGCSQAHQLGMEDNPQEILDPKLNNPHVELTSNQSISLVNHCATLGEYNAAPAADKEVLMALGNTGVGKSTFLNCLMGCEMKEEFDEFEEEIIIVHPESHVREIMPIGHGRRSQTFMPQIAPDPEHTHRAYCDCPGFADNRGAEINIANAINTKRVLQQATGVKAIFLAKYQDLLDRALGIQNMENMCLQMFGGVDNLRRHQNAVLLGITKAPLYNRRGQPFSLNTIRSRITQANTPTAQILASRSFLFDPLDRGSNNTDFWSIERCRTEIAQLNSIPQREAATLFQTVLTDSDQTKLKLIMREQATALAEDLERDDYQAAENHWQSLTRLRVIGNDEVETMVKELAELPLKHFVLRRVAAYEKEALQHNFEEAERQLDLLRMLISHFPHEQLECSIESLEVVLHASREKKRIEEESIRKKLEQAKREAAKKAREEADRELQEEAEEVRRRMDRGCCTIS